MQQRHEIAYSRTVDTYLIVIAICVYHSLQDLGLAELWMGLALAEENIVVTYQFTNYVMNLPSRTILPCFHWMRCVKVIFRGIGKNTALNKWMMLPEMTDIFISFT